MDILYSNSSAENVKIIRNYRGLMDEIDALVPYEEREYKEEEDNEEDGCWENGGTIEGLLAYITRIRDENQKLKELIHKDDDMVMMLTCNIDELKDENKKLKDENKILKEYLQGRAEAWSNGFKKAEQ